LREFEELFETMLHELAHIVHGKHDSHFFELMDTLRQEWQELSARGIVLDAGGFPTVGGQRSSYTNHNPMSAAQGRSAALAAAEKRAAVGRLMGSGRVGGASCLPGSTWAGLSPRERAARAAELRAQAALRGLGDEELAEVQGRSMGTVAGSSSAAPPPMAAAPPVSSTMSLSQGSSGASLSKRPRRCSCGGCREGTGLARVCTNAFRKDGLPSSLGVMGADTLSADDGRPPIHDVDLEAALQASAVEAASGAAKADADLEYALRVSAEQASVSTTAGPDPELEEALRISAVEASKRRACSQQPSQGQSSRIEDLVMDISDDD